MKTFRKGGIHPDACKLTADTPVVAVDTPASVRLLLAQGIGAPSKCIVKPGDTVVIGDKIAEAGGFVGAPVHSPVCGTVRKIEKVRNIRGLWQDAVIIETDREATPPASPEPLTPQQLDELTPKQIIDTIGDAGIVGLGGAAFPTRVKFSIPEGKKADYLLINGAECEPYLTCDDALMRTCPEKVVQGARLLMRAAGAPQCVIGIEENKPEAIRAISRAVGNMPAMSVAVLRKKYPQGGEKQLINAITGRTVPLGGLPLDVGCIVDNVATAAAVYDAVALGKPLTHRIVTVTGPGLANPGNFLAPIGISVEELLAQAGGIPDDTAKIISGGPMMGQAIAQTDAPTAKAMGGFLVLPAKNASREAYGPCVRCAKCVAACPMGLEPYLLMLLASNHDWETAQRHQAMGCLECGCCSFICPSDRPLLDFIKLTKSEIKKLKK